MSVKPNLKSKFWKTFLTLLVALLTFAGPTYMVYMLVHVLNVDYVSSMISGGILFIAGLILLWYLVKNKIVS
jgi:hypothetical protein